MSDLKETTSDERIMAAIAHGAILLPMWGTIVSIIIWVTQKDKSAYMRHQGLQAVGWQVSQIALMILGMGCYMCSFFSIIPASEMAPINDSGFPLFFFVPFGTMGLMMLVTLVFIVIGIYAAVRSLQGRLFTYPIIGHYIENYQAQ
jgi:uncharacterized Tic20 family protein